MLQSTATSLDEWKHVRDTCQRRIAAAVVAAAAAGRRRYCGNHNCVRPPAGRYPSVFLQLVIEFKLPAAASYGACILVVAKMVNVAGQMWMTHLRAWMPSENEAARAVSLGAGTSGCYWA